MVLKKKEKVVITKIPTWFGGKLRISSSVSHSSELVAESALCSTWHLASGGVYGALSSLESDFGEGASFWLCVSQSLTTTDSFGILSISCGEGFFDKILQISVASDSSFLADHRRILPSANFLIGCFRRSFLAAEFNRLGRILLTNLFSTYFALIQVSRSALRQKI